MLKLLHDVNISRRSAWN